jgi:hypothetical protein
MVMPISRPEKVNGALVNSPAGQLLTAPAPTIHSSLGIFTLCSGLGKARFGTWRHIGRAAKEARTKIRQRRGEDDWKKGGTPIWRAAFLLSAMPEKSGD